MGKRRMRKLYEASFKARVAWAALKGDKTLSELAESAAVHLDELLKFADNSDDINGSA